MPKKINRITKKFLPKPQNHKVTPIGRIGKEPLILPNKTGWYMNTLQDVNITHGADGRVLYSDGSTVKSLAPPGGVGLYLYHSGSGGQLQWLAQAAYSIFKTVNCPLGTDPVAQGAADTLNLTSSDSNIQITGDSSTDTVDFTITDLECDKLYHTGGLRVPVRLESSTYTANFGNHFIIMLTSGGNLTLNLPDVNGRNGTVYKIIKSSAANTLTIDPFGTDLIDGAGTKAITAHLHCIEITSYGGDWYTSSHNQ